MARCGRCRGELPCACSGRERQRRAGLQSLIAVRAIIRRIVPRETEPLWQRALRERTSA